MNDKLTVTTKPTFSLKKGIAANRAQAEEIINTINPLKVPNRIGMVFDDSGSMGGQAIQDAHSAVKNFTASCNFNDTSIAIYPLNLEPKPLTVDYDILNMFVMGIKATGSTALYTKLLDMFTKESITRAVVFSDGDPTDSKLLGNSEGWDSKPSTYAVDCIDKYKAKEIPIDTIYIGKGKVGYTDDSEDANEVYASGYNEMKEISKRTNGIFIHFTDSNSLSKNLKYLAPRYRALLANAELKEKIQKGESL